MRRAILIDAMGTMLRLLPPWELIDAGAVAGIEPARVRAAFRTEMAYYRDHAEQGSDAERLAELRERCAAVLSAELGREVGVATMMAAIRFEAYSDAGPALGELRGLGLRLVCVSNWDSSLPEVLQGLGLAPLLDGVVTSARAGASKPDPAIFAAALEIAGCDAGAALHVGDSDEDVIGAERAGIDVLRIDRSGAGMGQIASLNEISEHPALRE